MKVGPRDGASAPPPSARVARWPLYITSRTVRVARVVRIHEWGPHKTNVDVFIEDPVTKEELAFVPTFITNRAQAAIGAYAVVGTDATPGVVNIRQIIPQASFELRYLPTDTPVQYKHPPQGAPLARTRALAVGSGKRNKDIEEARRREKEAEYVKHNSSAIIEGFDIERKKERLRAKEKPRPKTEGDESAWVPTIDRTPEL